MITRLDLTLFSESLLKVAKIEGSDDQEGDEDGTAIKVSHLNLVDLAGSERAKQTGAIGDRLKEGANINNSLMILGQVISKLSEGAKDHIPFRNSKLTRILKNSLGGNTKTAIICTVTPAEEVQTKSTLDFAQRAKKIVQHAHVNEILDERALMNRQKKEIADLKKQLEQLQNSDLNEKLHLTNEELEKQKLEIEEHKKKNADLLAKLQDQFLSSTMGPVAPWQDGSKSNFMSSVAGAQNLRRMTFCAPSGNAGNRRVSFGGALRLKI